MGRHERNPHAQEARPNRGSASNDATAVHAIGFAGLASALPNRRHSPSLRLDQSARFVSICGNKESAHARIAELRVISGTMSPAPRRPLKNILRPGRKRPPATGSCGLKARSISR